jgi:hypothetical protein
MVTLPVDSGERKATERQVSLLRELAEERIMQPQDYERLLSKLNHHDDPQNPYRMTFVEAHGSINWFFKTTRPKPGVVPSHIQAMPGYHTNSVAQQEREAREERREQFARGTEKFHQDERPISPATRDIRRDPATLLTSGVFRKDNETYIIVPTRGGKHIAKRYVETPPRLTTGGDTVKFDWVSAPGVIWALYESDRLPVSDIEALMIQHSVCVYPGCFRRLKAAKSVAVGMGKVHAKRLGLI